jgi:MraZ protein
VFYGEYQHILDVKNRIIIPAKFRAGLSDAFIITKGGWGSYLTIYTMEEWRSLEARIKQLPQSDESVRMFARIVFGGACECVPDTQGRVLIPSALKAYAGIVKDVITVGVSGKIEVWSKENYENQMEKGLMDDAVSARMSEFGI